MRGDNAIPERVWLCTVGILPFTELNKCAAHGCGICKYDMKPCDAVLFVKNVVK
jgi:hypothetical protein